MVNLLWDQFDSNQDGVLSQDEISKMFDFLFHQTQLCVEHRYAEGGRFAASERRTIRHALEECKSSKEATIKAVIDTLDTDHNGQVSREEFQANFKAAVRQIFMPLYCTYTSDKAWDHIIQACEKGTQPLDADLDLVWASIDTDGNGTLQESEAFQFIPTLILAIRDERLYKAEIE